MMKKKREHSVPSPFGLALPASLPLKWIYQLWESNERKWKANYFFIHGLLIWLISLSYSFDLRRPEGGKVLLCNAGRAGLLWIPPTPWMKEGGSMRKADFSIWRWKKEKGQTISDLTNMTEWGRAPYVVSLYHHLKCAKLRLVEASPWRFSLLLRAIPLFR